MTNVELSAEARRHMRQQKLLKVQQMIDVAGGATAKGVPSEAAHVQATVALANVLMLVVERLDEISSAIDDHAGVMVELQP